MADLLDYAITVTGGAPAPQFTVSARVVDSSNQSIVLKDLTGNRALTWPAAFSALTTEQQDELRRIISSFLVQCAIAGL